MRRHLSEGCFEVEASNESDSYERASAFLSDWLEVSLLDPTSTAIQHPQRRHSMPVTGSSRTFRRRKMNFSSGDNIQSLAISLHASIMMRGGSSGVFPPLPFRERPKAREPPHQAMATCSSGNPPVASSLLRSASCSSSATRFSSRSRNESSEGRTQRWYTCEDPENESLPSTSTIKHIYGSRSQSRRSSSSKELGTIEDDNLVQTHHGLSALPLYYQPVKKNASHSKKICKLGDATFNGTVKAAQDTARPRFELGDTLRNPKHQIIESDPSKALSLVAQLRVHDFAWILRSSREWTYAIVADFPENTSIRFVIDKSGKTKTLEMKHWVKCIRLVDKAT